jgi:prepilin-type N-terminal cleavage/methylation domain-containing protein
VHTTSYHPLLNGFSITELMLSVAILAILGAIAIPVYQGYIRTSEMGKVIHEMKQIELMVENSKLDTGDYPNSLTEVGISLLDP